MFLLQRKHYKEYLSQLINDNGLDPIDTMTVDDIKVLMVRHRVEIPAQSKLPMKNGYLKKLKQVNVCEDGAVEGFLG